LIKFEIKISKPFQQSSRSRDHDGQSKRPQNMLQPIPDYSFQKVSRLAA
jgi:hypothetical protein